MADGEASVTGSGTDSGGCADDDADADADFEEGVLGSRAFVSGGMF